MQAGQVVPVSDAHVRAARSRRPHRLPAGSIWPATLPTSPTRTAPTTSWSPSSTTAGDVQGSTRRPGTHRRATVGGRPGRDRPAAGDNPRRRTVAGRPGPGPCSPSAVTSRHSMPPIGRSPCGPQRYQPCACALKRCAASVVAGMLSPPPSRSPPSPRPTTASGSRSPVASSSPDGDARPSRRRTPSSPTTRCPWMAGPHSARRVWVGTTKGPSARSGGRWPSIRCVPRRPTVSGSPTSGWASGAMPRRCTRRRRGSIPTRTRPGATSNGWPPAWLACSASPHSSPCRRCVTSRSSRRLLCWGSSRCLPCPSPSS